MRLEPGSEVGVYRVVALLGSGGMGEVSRATDGRLNRDVALKVLKDSLGHDPDRIARFRREAQVLASLNHPNIGAIYGFEEAAGVSALVLELVEGPTLADRIARGALPLREALAVARQIADALDAAHERGIVHRDLKPANIKLRSDGTVKVLDFGLAKALDQAVGAGPQASSVLTNSPTLASPAMTAAGVLLGTAAYMSPEQARGDVVDKRTDIWAFACVLVEMLTGASAFQGRSISDVIANILKSDPPLNALPADAAALEPVPRRCLEKDPQRRLRDIGDVKLLLVEAAAGAADAARPAGVQAARGFTLRGLAVAVVAAAVVGGAVVGFVARSRIPSSAARVQRFPLATPEAIPLSADTYGANVAISPDASRLVYSTTREGVPMLATRRFDRVEADSIAGSEGGFDPVFSPDGEHVAFAIMKALKRVDAAGGPSVVICPVDAYFSGASWGEDDSIVFTQMTLGMFRVPASGGKPEKIAMPDPSRQERAFLRPTVLADGAVLYTTIMTDGSMRIMARRGSDVVTVVRDGFDPHYLASGQLVYGQGQRLMAVRFDPATFKTDGTPVPVQEGAAVNLVDGIANVSIARDGTAAIVTGHHADAPGGIVWIDAASGRSTPAINQQLEYPRNLRLSPDGRRLALTVGPGGLGQLWVYTLDGSSQPLKLTFHDHNIFPVWSPDGRQIAFLNRTNGISRLSLIATDGSELEPKAMRDGDDEAVPWSWSLDKTLLLVGKMSLGKLWLLHLPDNKYTPWIQTPFSENNGSFSPDDRWIAYSTNQTGGDEIWVRPFPGPGTPVRISSGGGRRPIWARDGKQLYFENGAKMFAARVLSPSPEFRAEAPRIVLERGFMFGDTDANLRYIDLAPDGRFIAVESAQAGGGAAIVLVQHWDEELARLLPR